MDTYRPSVPVLGAILSPAHLVIPQGTAEPREMKSILCGLYLTAVHGAQQFLEV